MKFFETINKKHRPDGKQMKIADAFINSLNEKLSEFNVKAKAVMGGSAAKGTYLKNDFDVDIFVVFDKLYVDDNISDILSKLIKAERVHGSRDYFQVKHKGIMFEIVPVIQINESSEAFNVTDVSPLHVKWVTKYIKNLSDDVRLFKLFCKANDLYGAESYINGFSGYIGEILVIYYGGFEKLLNAASNWKSKQIIDPAKLYTNDKEIIKKLNSSKKVSPLIIIDPVQKDRNAAAAMNNETYNKFIFLAKRFLMDPSLDFFKVKKFSLSTIKKEAKKLGCELLVFNVDLHFGKRDVVGGKIVKVYNFLEKHLTLNDFEVIDSGWNWDKKCTLWYIVTPAKLSKYKLQEGPVIYAPDANFKSFLDKHGKNTLVKGNKIYAKVKRKYVTVKEFQKIIKDEWFKDKVVKINAS